MGPGSFGNDPAVPQHTFSFPLSAAIHSRRQVMPDFVSMCVCLLKGSAAVEVSKSASCSPDQCFQLFPRLWLKPVV